MYKGFKFKFKFKFIITHAGVKIISAVSKYLKTVLFTTTYKYNKYIYVLKG